MTYLNPKIGSLMPKLAALFTFLAIASVNQAFGQACRDGHQKLIRSEYRGAETSLIQGYRAAKSAADKAECLKSLGVAQYMLSKKANATKSFQLALRLNPGLKLSESEVADESVIPFFNQIKSPRKLAVPAAKPSSPQGAARGKPGLSTVKSKKTLLKVMANVPNAQISIDGISYGTTGSELEVSPGTVVLEISAAGYIKKAIKVQLQPLTTSTVSVDLEKIKPKPVAPQPKARVASDPKNQNRRAIRPSSGQKPKDDLFAAEPGSADDFSAVPVSPPIDPSQQAQAIAPPPPPASPVLPQGAYMTTPSQGGLYPQPYSVPAYPQPQPYAPYGYPPQPVYPQYQQPMYQQPAYPQYQQQPYMPPYSQPLPPQAPSVYAPYQGFQQPAADPFASGSSLLLPPPEPATAYGSSDLPATASDLGPPPPPPAEVGRPPPMKPPSDVVASAGKRKTSKSSAGCSTFVKLLPFGVGQFCQGSTLKGLLFAGAQAGGLFFYKQNSDAAVQYQSQLNQVLVDRDAERSQHTGTDLEAFDAETESKKSEANAAINQANSNATMSIAFFGGAWALGVTDAFLFPPKKAKTSKRAKLSLLLPTFQQQNTTLALVSEHAKDDVVQMWYAGYVLASETKTRGSNHSGAVQVGVQWEL